MVKKDFLMKCHYSWDPNNFSMIHFPDFLFGDFYPCPSFFSQDSFIEVPISVSRSPRLTHPCPHLFAELEKLAFLVVISCLRNKRVLSSGGLHMGTRATNRALLCCQNKIPSIDCPTTQTNLAIGREIWHQAPRDQFYPVF